MVTTSLMKILNFFEIFVILKFFEIFERGRGGKVQNWPHIILKNNARHRIKTIY
jgi:hypothetical protein